MMKYKFPEEKDFILYFARILRDNSIEEMLDKESLNEEDAKHLSYFYWRMIDCSIEVEKKGPLPWPEGAEFWSEKVMYSISAFIKRSGFGAVWDAVVDEQ